MIRKRQRSSAFKANRMIYEVGTVDWVEAAAGMTDQASSQAEDAIDALERALTCCDDAISACEEAIQGYPST
jgi:hypothetical protein